MARQPTEAASDPLAAFLRAATVPREHRHTTGTLTEAETIRTAHPEIATATMYSAAVLGDEGTLRRFLARDPASATAAGGPYQWNPLTCLCFSRYLRLDRSRSEGFMGAARALLDAGVDANSGWFEESHQPAPAWESVLYGAAGIAHHAELTRLLVERGADVNDDEATYHTPEGYDNEALAVLVESGRLTPESLAVMLIRKADWHDFEGIKYLLEHGADPNRMSRWDFSPLHHALRRDNAIENIEAMLDHGADPTLGHPGNGRSAVSFAVRGGRRDVLELFERRGIPLALTEVERLIAACARGDQSGARSIAAREPELVRELIAQGAPLLAEFSGTGNRDGVRLLLDLGVPVAAIFDPEDGYWGLAPGSTALHVAAWRARSEVVKLLLERGAAVDARDGAGRTPLALAVRACVDSYWTELRSPESVAALLARGAAPDRAPFPCGYAEVDALLERYRKAS